MGLAGYETDDMFCGVPDVCAVRECAGERAGYGAQGVGNLDGRGRRWRT